MNFLIFHQFNNYPQLLLFFRFFCQLIVNYTLTLSDFISEFLSEHLETRAYFPPLNYKEEEEF